MKQTFLVFSYYFVFELWSLLEYRHFGKLVASLVSRYHHVQNRVQDHRPFFNG